MEIVRPAAQLDLGDQTDEDLLAYMAMRDDDPCGAESAFAAFHRRHIRHVYGVCRRVASDFLDESGLEDLVSDTFFRVYAKAGTFKPLNSTDPKQQLASTRAWLGTIATNLFRSILRGQRGIILEHLDDEEWERIQSTVPLETQEEADDPRVSLIEEAIRSLSKKEQRVIRVTFQWHPHPLPHNVSRDLASELKTTNDYIRHIRKTALQKITEFVQARLHT
jgi:RNA polymerase sigma factor (sigma-70 family)